MVSTMNTSETSRVDYPQIVNLFLLLFCGYVVIWYLQIGYRIPSLGAIRFEFIYAAILTVIAVLFTPKIDTDCPLLYYLVLYFMVIAIQIPFSYDFETSWKVFVDRVFKFAFMSFFIIAFVRSPGHMKYFIAAFLLACLKMGQEGLVGRLSGSLIWENQGIMRLHGSTPLYGHPNSFSGMALGTLPFVYYLYPLSRKYIKLLLLLVGFLSLNIVLFTGSRTGYVGILAFLIYIYIASENKKKIAIALCLTAVIILPQIPADYVERLQSVYTLKEKEGASSESRILILKDAVQIFMENPLGVGLSAFPKIRMEKYGRFQDTHNLYLEIATNLGIQGVIVFGLLVYNMLKILNKIKYWARENSEKLLARNTGSQDTVINDLKFIELMALATSSFICIRLVLGLFGMDLYEIYWWFAMGITVSLFGMMGRIKQKYDLTLEQY